MMQALKYLLLLGLSIGVRASYGQTIHTASFPDAKIDIQHIRLEQSVDWANKSLSGRADITLKLLESGRNISLDAGLLQIKAINNLTTKRSLSSVYHGGDENNALHINLDNRYAAGDTMTLAIWYSTHWENQSDPDNLWGSYGKGIRFFQPTTTEPRKRRQLWTMGVPDGNRYWFPGNTTPDDLHTFELLMTVDTPLIVISNGRLLKTIENENGSRTFHWTSDAPMANHQAGMVVGEYRDHVQRSGNTLLHSYGYPDERSAVEATTVRLPDMFRFFSEKTGVPYPYPSYAQVTIQDFPWGGGDHASFSAVSENMIDDYGTHADFFYLWDGVEASDLAAQWVCNAVSPRDWQHAWLCKGLATYLDCLYSEYKNGCDEMLLWNRAFQLNTYLNDWNSQVRRPIIPENAEQSASLIHDNYTSLRAALVFHMLREHLGDATWWKVIHRYLSENRFKTVETRDFIRAVEAESGEPMQWFFDQWAYQTGHPVFEVSDQYDVSKKTLTVRVLQTQTPFDSLSTTVKYFRGKVKIALDNRLETVWIDAKPENVYHFSCKTQPRMVWFDHQSAWIAEVNTQKTLKGWLDIFQESPDVMARRMAMLKLQALANDSLATTAQQRDSILAAFRRVISSNAYWRVRYNAMQTLQRMLVPNPATATQLDEQTLQMLRNCAAKEGSWMRAAALSMLGATRQPTLAGLYKSYLRDSSDRVVNAAAIALGKSGNAEAFEVLKALLVRPSWKNQSLISALNGLKELKDPRGADMALQALLDVNGIHWTLATPIWDFRLTAAETLASLGGGDRAFSIIFERLKAAYQEKDLNDIFSNLLLIKTLNATNTQQAFDWLKTQYKDNPKALEYLEKMENQ